MLGSIGRKTIEKITTQFQLVHPFVYKPYHRNDKVKFASLPFFFWVSCIRKLNTLIQVKHSCFSLATKCLASFTQGSYRHLRLTTVKLLIIRNLVKVL